MKNETWKDIPGYEGLYQASSLGRIKSLERQIWNGFKFYKSKEKILNPYKKEYDYSRVGLSKNKKVKHYLCHRLIAMAFIPNLENKPEINHIDGNKDNNYIDNLEWCTHSENQIHAFKMGLKQSGIKHSCHKLTESQVNRIRYIANNIKVEYKYWSKIAKSLNISRSVISSIIHNKNWKYI